MNGTCANSFAIKLHARGRAVPDRLVRRRRSSRAGALKTPRRTRAPLCVHALRFILSPQPSTCASRQVSGRGLGLVAKRPIRAGDLIVAERPLLHWCALTPRSPHAGPAPPASLRSLRTRSLACASACAVLCVLSGCSACG